MDIFILYYMFAYIKYLCSITMIFVGLPLFAQSQWKMQHAYDKIMLKMEESIEQNYYSDSALPVRHSEYTFLNNDTTKVLLKAIYLEYFGNAVWSMDSKYYVEKYHVNTRYPYRHYFYGKLYNPNPDTEYGAPFPSGRKYPYANALQTPHSHLYRAILNHRKRKEDAEYHRNKDVAARNITYSVNKQIHSDGKTTKTYMVADTIFDGIQCYKLTKHEISTSVYGKKERDAFEKKLLTEPELQSAPQEYVEELKYHVEYWANSTCSSMETYVINKHDYALLYFSHTGYSTTMRNEKFLTECVTEYYVKVGKKYQQDFYKYYTLNFVRGMGFRNIKNIATWIVQRPLNKNYEMSALKPYPDKIAVAYEEICEIVPQPDAEMLMEWEEYNQQK